MNDPVGNPYISDETRMESGSTLAQSARIGQIITFALAHGVILTGAILGFLTFGKERPDPAGMPVGGGDLILPAIGLALGIGACVIAIVIPKMLRRTAEAKFRASGVQSVDSRHPSDTALSPELDQLVGSSKAATLIGQAVLEGAAMMNLVLMFIQPNLIQIAVAIICVIGIVLQVPTVGKLQQTIESAVRE